MTTFKIYFSEDNIRKINLQVPTYEKFIQCLEELYPKFHLELTVKYMDEDGDKISIDSQLEWEEMMQELNGMSSVKLWVEEGSGQYFKDGPEPETLKFYVDKTTKEAVKMVNEFEEQLQRNVPECLSTFFKSGKIIPTHIPEFLKSAISMQYVEDNVVDMDVDIPELFDLLHSKALNLLDSIDVSDIEQGRDYLTATLRLVPDHMIALYNLACAESLLGNADEAISTLEQAIDNGYRNFEHMLSDADFANIRDTEAFQILAARIASLTEFETNEEITPEVEIETTPEPEVEIETIPEPVEIETIPEPKVEIETIPEPEVETEPKMTLSESVLPLHDAYSVEMNTLKDMGFTADPDVLLLLLEQFKGNVESVTQFLLGFSH